MNKIKAIRKHLGLTQIEFAKVVHLSQGTISLLENGVRKATKEQLRAIAKGVKDLLETPVHIDLGLHKDVEEKDYLMTFGEKVVGVTYEGRQERIPFVEPGDRAELVHEPENIHDPNAIRVYVRGLDVGFLPKELARELCEGGTSDLRADVDKVLNGEVLGLRISIYSTDEERAREYRKK